MTLLSVKLCYYCAGTIIEGPANVTYYPNLTVLPIELICNVTGVTAWSVNDRSYTLGDLANGKLPGHNVTGNNILIDTPVNNTEYICVSQASGIGETRSDPAYIYIAGEFNKYVFYHNNIFRNITYN